MFYMQIKCIKRADAHSPISRLTLKQLAVQRTIFTSNVAAQVSQFISHNFLNTTL